MDYSRKKVILFSFFQFKLHNRTLRDYLLYVHVSKINSSFILVNEP
jgi:hypothetical protein